MTTDQTTATLPDDPRDCCRAAIDILNGDDFEDAETLIRDVLAVTFAASDAANPERLQSLLGRAEDAMALLHGQINRVRALVRHGTTDCREIDAEQDEIRRAEDEGREPPYPVKLMTRVLEIEREREQQGGSAS